MVSPDRTTAKLSASARPTASSRPTRSNHFSAKASLKRVEFALLNCASLVPQFAKIVDAIPCAIGLVAQATGAAIVKAAIKKAVKSVAIAEVGETAQGNANAKSWEKIPAVRKAGKAKSASRKQRRGREVALAH
jgi:hypothetical protein